MLLDPVNHLVSCPSVQVKGGRWQRKWSREETLASESRSLFSSLSFGITAKWMLSLKTNANQSEHIVAELHTPLCCSERNVCFCLYAMRRWLTFEEADPRLCRQKLLPKPFLIKVHQVGGSLLQWTVLNMWAAAASVLLTRQQAWLHQGH